MIVIPSFRLADDLDPAAILATLGEWSWFGFQRIELELITRSSVRPNRRALELLCRETLVPLQVDVDVSEPDEIGDLLDAGASTVVVGPRGLDDPDWLHDVATSYAGALSLKLPARERRTRTRGAIRTLPVDLAEELALVAGLPLAGIIISFAGDAIEMPDLGNLEDIAGASPTPISVWTSDPTIETLRDLEFRAIASTIAPNAALSALIDEQTLARSFSD